MIPYASALDQIADARSEICRRLRCKASINPNVSFCKDVEFCLTFSDTKMTTPKQSVI